MIFKEHTCAQASIVLGPTPPSTSISMSGNFSLKYLTFGIISAINFCPPNPGSTVITRIISTRSAYGTTTSTAVLGLMAIPTCGGIMITFAIKTN